MKILIRTLTILLPALIFFLGYILSARATENDFQVVVNPLNPIMMVDQKFLAEIFLKKKVFWPDSHVIMVVDLEPSAMVRQQFSERILDRPVSAVRNYWQQLLFSGRAVPPPEFRTEQEVLNFINTHEDAIGYVSGRADLHDLKVLTIR